MSDKPTVDDALEQIETLATRIPSSSSFESASLAQRILEYARQVQIIRSTTSSNSSQAATPQPASAPLPSTGKP